MRCGLGRAWAAAVLVLVVVAVWLAVVPQAGAGIGPLPWVVPASPPLPPDPTVPYLPGVRTLCADGNMQCFYDLEQILGDQARRLGCDHEAIAADAYHTITQHLSAATVAGAWQRPDRITHEARQYAQEYLDQSARWHAGEPGVSPAWAFALEAMRDRKVTG